MNDENKKLQNTILKIYKEFNRICEKHNLTYYAIGGTCIGTIRHNGFIPWDDDIDVAMPIEDFIKFKEIAVTELNENYKLIDYLNPKRFYRNNFFLEIEDTRTTFVEKDEINDIRKYKGVFLDIMPICSCPKDEKGKNKLLLKFYKYVKLNLSRNKKINEIESFKGKLLWIVLKPIAFFHKDTYYLEKIEKLAKENLISNDKDILFAWRIPVKGSYKNCFPYDYFSKVINLNFEDTIMKCPIKYDAYLKDDFGDYMKLPPVEKRIAHKPLLFDLDKSYLEYQKEYTKIRGK